MYLHNFMLRFVRLLKSDLISSVSPYHRHLSSCQYIDVVVLWTYRLIIVGANFSAVVDLGFEVDSKLHIYPALSSHSEMNSTKHSSFSKRPKMEKASLSWCSHASIPSAHVLWHRPAPRILYLKFGLWCCTLDLSTYFCKAYVRLA